MDINSSSSSRAVVALLFGSKVDTDTLGTNWQQIFQIAESNDVHMPIIEKLCELPQTPGELLDLRDKVRREFTSFWEITGNIQDILSEKGIETTLIKTLRRYDFYDWDIDLVIHRGDFSRTISVLASHGWHIRRVFSDYYRVSVLIELGDKSRVVSEKSPHHVIRHSLLVRSEVTPFIHLHRRCAWHGVVYIPDEVLWSHTITQTYQGRDYRVPSPTMNFLIICAHSVFENYDLGLGDFYELAGALQEDRVDMQLATEVAERNHWRKGLNLVIETVRSLSNDLSNLEALPYSYGLSRLWPVWLERAKFHFRKPRNWNKGVLELINAFFYVWHRR